MFYYEGAKFPELKGKLVVGLHGYRPTGSRIRAATSAGLSSSTRAS